MKNENPILIIAAGLTVGILFGISVHLGSISKSLKIIASPPNIELRELKNE